MYKIYLKTKSILPLLFLALFSSLSNAYGQSSLLENVKRNPEEAKSMCRNFKVLNSKGISATSQKSIEKISKNRNLNTVDAEILSIYVIGLFCPDVR